MQRTPSTPPALRPTLPAWAVVTPERLAHIIRVAEVAAGWAEAMGVPDSERNRWLRAIWLHDAMRDATAAELEQWASSTPGPETLRHGPASAARAKAEGETDRGVLDAVRYHSVGLAEWDMVGRVLYCADYLEPGRNFDAETRAGLRDEFGHDPRGVLREVARAPALRHPLRLAPSRSYGAFLEQRHRRTAAAALIAVAAIVVALLVRPPAPPVTAEAAGPAPDQLAYPVPPADGRVVVEVLNTTDRTGMARLAARMLRAHGLDVVAVGNADSALAETRVIIRRGSGDRARDIVRALGAGRVSTSIDTLRRVDLTVLLGADFHPVTPLHP